MGESNKAYELSIDDGKVRIVIKIEDIKVDVINSTNEFITPSDDEVSSLTENLVSKTFLK